MAQSVQKQIRILPAIEPECHFIQVGREMFCADFMPRSHDAALEQGECRFNGIGVNVSSEADIFLRGVIDGFVFRIAHGVLVGLECVCDDDVNIGTDIFPNVLRQGSSLGILGVKETQVTIALTDTDNYFFGGLACFRSPANLATAYVGFIHFDCTVQHRLIHFFHGSTNAVAQVPCGFISHAKGTFDLVSGHTFPRFTEKQGDHKPFRQGKVRVIENRASGDRELIFAIAAPEQFCIGFKTDNVLSFATRAHRAFGPTQSFEKFTAFFVSRKQFSNVRESHEFTVR